jgi:phosphate uptake regulator
VARCSATQSGCPILPVALNAGEFWPRRGFLKRPGTVQVVFGPLLESVGRSPQELIRQVEDWIESNMRLISLERIGDEAKAIAERTLSIYARGVRPQEAISLEMERLALIADQRVQQALDSFARLDAEQAWALAQTDESDGVFEDIMRSLSTYALDGELPIGTVIDIALALKALQRVAERARNLAEYVIYIVEGQDIRHSNVVL